MFRKTKTQKIGSSGITLLETMVAIYILVTGVASIAGTAVYSFSTQGKLMNKFTGIQLAREGVEVVRLHRDTNWLPPNAPQLCSDIGPDQYCYPNWQTNILPNCAAGCQAVFDPVNNVWSLTSFASLGSYALYEQPNSTYTTVNNGGNPVFYRKVLATTNTTPPYTISNPELKISSTVAWVGAGCPNDFLGNPDAAKEQCRVRVEESMTNWKDF